MENDEKGQDEPKGGTPTDEPKDGTQDGSDQADGASKGESSEGE